VQHEVDWIPATYVRSKKKRVRKDALFTVANMAQAENVNRVTPSVLRPKGP